MAPLSTSITEQYQIILDSLTEGVFTVDLAWRIMSFNRAAEEITGVPREEAIGQLCHEVFRANVCETGCVLRQTMMSGVPVRNMPIHIVRADESSIPISVTTSLLKDTAGRVVGGVETFRDLRTIQQLRKELRKQHSFGDIISKNDKMLRLFSVLPQIAESGSTVLIEGASGTGKELFARAIHNNSARRKALLWPLIVAHSRKPCVNRSYSVIRRVHLRTPGKTSRVDLP